MLACPNLRVFVRYQVLLTAIQFQSSLSCLPVKTVLPLPQWYRRAKARRLSAMLTEQQDP